MKTTLIAAAVVLAGAPLYAEGFTFGGEVDSEYKLDAESMTVTLTPEVNYGMGMWNFEASTDISVYDSTSADSNLVLFDALDDGSHPVLDFEATYAMSPSLELSAGTSWDLNKSERGEVTVGASFSF